MFVLVNFSQLLSINLEITIITETAPCKCDPKFAPKI